MAFRYRLDPSSAQAAAMVEHCAQARFVWNLGLEQRNAYRPAFGPTPGLAEQCRQLTEARAATWLGAGSTVVQQAALRDLDQAFRNWWGGSHRRPTWRKRGQHEGFAVRDVAVRKINRKWAETLVPKVGWVRFRLSRPLGKCGGARVTLDRAGRWHVSFAAVPPPIDGPGTGEVVGVDRGVVVPFCLSTGEMVAVPALTSGECRRKKRLQRKMARQVKGSNRRSVTKHDLAVLSAREADRRKDAVEKFTTDLARRFDRIQIEDLKVQAMSARGRGKRGLNRGIRSAGWAMFTTRLEHKAPGRVVKVRAAYTSQRCSACGEVDRNNRKNQASFRCMTCGYADNADVNAAKNIAAGHAVTGRGGDVRRPGLRPGVQPLRSVNHRDQAHVA